MDCSPPGYSVQGFSRQEYWSGLPFPSPGHLPEPGIKPGSPALQTDSLPPEPPEKPVPWKKVKSEVQVTQSCPTLCDPMHYTVHGILWARILDLVPFPFSRGSPEMEPRFPALQADSLPAEPQGKPKNTGVGSLSLLQDIFPTRELNLGLLHCRQILYQLSYQFSSVQSLSRVWLCDPMNHSTPGLPVHHQLLESIQTHVHWVGDAI